MASPLSDRVGSQPASNIQGLVLSQFQDDLAERLNVEQMFILIDGVLPFEACLYYQVLPLYLEGSRLNLGMVTPDDAVASDYVRRIISYLNYSLVPRPISSEALQAVLSAYLNYATRKQQTPSPSSSSSPETPPPENQGRSRSKSTLKVDQSDRQTFIVDSPDELDPQSDPLIHPGGQTRLDMESGSEEPSLPVEEITEMIYPVPEAPPMTPPPIPLEPPISPVQADGADAEAPVATPQLSMDDRRAALMGALPELRINAQHLESPVEVLATLPADQLLRELLARVLGGGIGRLYFERQKQYGRVLWSQNGVLQSIVDRLNLDTFADLIHEQKRLAHVPIVPTRDPQQVEIERIYQGSRLLLRFRFMPSTHGEEATLQVLRGAALKFYQQQQLAKLGRDAMSIAKQLQFKVNEIRDRSLDEPGLVQARLSALANLSEVLQVIEAQIDALQQATTHDDAEIAIPMPPPPDMPE
jgi:type II secretory ATPase GspE/PulE/Tfp pilus assembly ATPase PilB-like protein